MSRLVEVAGGQREEGHLGGRVHEEVIMMITVC